MTKTTTLCKIEALAAPTINNLRGQQNMILDNINTLTAAWHGEHIDGYPAYYYEISEEYATFIQNLTRYADLNMNKDINLNLTKYTKRLARAAFKIVDADDFKILYHGQIDYLYSNLLHNSNAMGQSICGLHWYRG